MAAMASITLDIPDSDLQALEALSNRCGVPLDILLRASLSNWLSVQKTDFVDASDYVLTKNAELYKRLA